jgi:arylsulfatase A
MNRRRFCQSLTLGALYSGGVGIGAAGRPRPNVVFVLADDLGWGDLDCYNADSAVATPNANRLAAEGMRFTDMHSASAVCTPSRYGILTGRYCWRTRLQHGVLEGYSPDLIEAGRLTMPLMLKQHGYYTCGVGKWHLGLGNEERTDFSKPLRPGPVDHGFDYYFGIPASLDMAPYLYFENDHVVEQPTSTTPGSKQPRGVFWRPGPIAPGFKLEQVLPTITSKAVGLIHDHMGKGRDPMFLYCALPAPHTPWLPLPEYRGRSKAGDYGDYVAEVDAMLGRIADAVKASGEEDNTIFIFTSDNGADWKIEDEARYAHRANAHWRGEKADIWEAGHRIPFLIRWPGHIRPGTLSDQLGCLTDVMASVAAVDGIALPDHAAEDSYDLSPAWLGRARGPIRPDIIDHSIDGMFAMRRGRWKLEVGLGSGGFSAPRRVEAAPGGPKGQLYDLVKDPGEIDNLYQKRPEIVDELETLLEKYRTQGYTRPMVRR